MTTVVDEATEPVLTANVALVAPAAIVTLEGTLAAVRLLLESINCAPPDGAGPLNVTVPVEEFPPLTLAGFSESEEREAGGGGRREREDKLKDQIAGLGSVNGKTT